MRQLPTHTEHADLEVVVGHVHYSVPLEISFYFWPEPPEVHVTDLILKTERGDKPLPDWIPYSFEEQIQAQLLKQRHERYDRTLE